MEESVNIKVIGKGMKWQQNKKKIREKKKN